MENFEKIKRKRGHGLFKRHFTYPSHLPRCNGKHSYRTWEEAEMMRLKQQERSGTILYIYECSHFHNVKVTHWHLTHKSPRK